MSLSFTANSSSSGEIFPSPFLSMRFSRPAVSWSACLEEVCLMRGAAAVGPAAAATAATAAAAAAAAAAGTAPGSAASLARSSCCARAVCALATEKGGTGGLCGSEVK